MDALQNSFIEKQLSRTNRNLLMVNLFLLAIPLVVLAFNYRYALNFIRGPKDISTQELLTLQNPNDRQQFFVKVKGDELRETGLQYVETETNTATNKVESETVKYEYKALDVGPRWLLVKTPVSATATSYSGALQQGSDSADTIARLEEKYPETKGMFLPFVLDAVEYRDDGYWALGIGIPVLLLVSWNIKKWLSRTADRTTHPIIKKLRTFGEPEQLSFQIESEMSQAPSSIGSTLVTRSWVFVPHSFGLKMARLADVVWIYKKVTKHSYNFIPTGKTYAAIVWSRSGDSLEIGGKQKRIDEVLQTVASRAPWAFTGYDNNVQAAWNGNRAALVQAVDERKAKLSGAASASSAHT